MVKKGYSPTATIVKIHHTYTRDHYYHPSRVDVRLSLPEPIILKEIPVASYYVLVNHRNQTLMGGKTAFRIDLHFLKKLLARRKMKVPTLEEIANQR